MTDTVVEIKNLTKRYGEFVALDDLSLSLNRGQILGFIGIKPTKVSYFSGATHPEPGKIDNWIKNVEKIGANAV